MWSVLQIHVAAWGLFEKKDVETANRVASARTMDGFKIRAKLVLSFPRPVGSAEAESVMMQYARAFASIVECELSNGDLPFEESELHQRITDSVQALPKKNVRLIGLHVLHKGAVSSRSMPAVKPGPDGKATVPAMAAVSAPPGRTSTPSQAAHTATTIKPEARGAGPLSAPGVMSQPPSVRGAVTVPAPATASPRSATTPAMRAPMPGAGGAGSPATRAMTVSGMPATGARPSPAGNADTPAAAPASGARPAQGASGTSATRVVSGVVPSAEPRIVRTKSGFLVALETSGAETGDDVGRAIAQPLRDAAAGLLLCTLDALHGSFADPLALFDGRVDPALQRALIGEACVCACYILYESLMRTNLPQMQSIQVVQSACVHAL
ncbi:MAG TPA: hypothetical protein VNN80_11560, partial [Polyangiaceae bacterium]|nr:hypothetical protein [Polyangiaceae bacterium]